MPAGRVHTQLVCLALALALGGCAGAPLLPPNPAPLDDSRLPPPDLTVSIAGLGPCTDAPDRRLRLSSQHPVTVLVHGCFGSAGRFRTLAQVLAFQGQQAACFSYDDRDSLMRSSAELGDAIESLADRLKSPHITVVGHSQGALVARKALVSEREDMLQSAARLSLVTVSGPFSGIRAAKPCGLPLVRLATLGLNDLACWLVSGDKWFEITSSSDFIRKPGALLPSVERHLLISTDERGSCRQRDEGGACTQHDFVFGLEEQRLPAVEQSPPIKSVQVRAGHVEIVGETGVTPHKLIGVLQQEGFMTQVAPERHAQFEALLARLYGSAP